jgi:hypothetical protein
MRYLGLTSAAHEPFISKPWKHMGEFPRWLMARLVKEHRRNAKSATWNRTAATEKADQWGPATLRVVENIVRQAQRAFSESNWSRSTKPQERARYYAGLLCLEVALLRTTDPSDGKRIADIVRKRLNKGQPLLVADAKYTQSFSYRISALPLTKADSSRTA